MLDEKDRIGFRFSSPASVEAEPPHAVTRVITLLIQYNATTHQANISVQDRTGFFGQLAHLKSFALGTFGAALPTFRTRSSMSDDAVREQEARANATQSDLEVLVKNRELADEIFPNRELRENIIPFLRGVRKMAVDQSTKDSKK